MLTILRRATPVTPPGSPRRLPEHSTALDELFCFIVTRWVMSTEQSSPVPERLDIVTPRLVVATRSARSVYRAAFAPRKWSNGSPAPAVK